ncbi:hypothetical protein SAMD00079811_49380 [Scytonema sp. HK-05]|uniref:hypothetical protein n=1 Tax=Scytonema sp. HK-05 TaxID=1137095 RepID=UPI0009373A9C|nr:hypothetical protein [Scytonema sp. HK-05]OKH41852.1 hypothetical protein NIES2130_39845 [Scytonema sp. HK-05]BAY47320.1 hypothetical protein SAMD00079811_49380 [Scytonema sp. HK-05]
MKPYFKVLFVVVVATATGLVANSQAVTGQNVEKKNLLLTQAQVQVQPVAISVALPELADVSLKGGKSLSGRVTAIDSSAQTLSMQRSDKTLPVPLKEVEKVVFRNGATAYRSNGQQIIRGERDRPKGQPVTWNNLPLGTFTIKNATQGLAVVNLVPPVVSPERLLGIQSVAKDRQYVVDEMQFNLQQKTMSIRATPY